MKKEIGLCICNGCGLLLVDSKPQAGTPLHNIEAFPRAMAMEVVGGAQVCPLCLTDENLSRTAPQSDRGRILVYLQNNDPNGCYTDDRVTAEGMEVLTLAQAVECLREYVQGEPETHFEDEILNRY